MAIDRRTASDGAPEREIARLCVVTGTVPIPGDMYERVNEFLAGHESQDWTIRRIAGGFSVERGKMYAEIVGVPCVAWFA